MKAQIIIIRNGSDYLYSRYGVPGLPDIAAQFVTPARAAEICAANETPQQRGRGDVDFSPGCAHWERSYFIEVEVMDH